MAERGLLRAEKNDDAPGAIMLAGVLACVELVDLRLEPSKAYASRMETFADQADTTALMMTLEVQAYQLGYVGEWQRLAKLCQTTMARLRLAGSYQVASAKVLWAEAQFALGRWDVAAQARRAPLSALRNALPDLEEMEDVCKVHIARIVASSGESAEAVEDVRRYLAAASDPGNVRSGGAVLGDAAAAIDEPDLWDAAYDLVLSEPAPVALVYSPTSVDRVRGRLATRLKRWADAIDHFEQAMGQLSDGGATWELLRTYQDYAVMRKSRGRRGDVNKAEALELLEPLDNLIRQ